MSKVIPLRFRHPVHQTEVEISEHNGGLSFAVRCNTQRMGICFDMTPEQEVEFFKWMLSRHAVQGSRTIRDAVAATSTRSP